MSVRSVFLSYSHDDMVWKGRLRTQLGVLERLDLIQVWDDRAIEVGSPWDKEILDAMKNAAAAIFLISAPYLASEYATRREIPFLVRRHRREGMPLIPVLLAPCPWPEVPWLRQLQMCPRDGRTVVGFRDKGAQTFSEVAQLLAHRLGLASRSRSSTTGARKKALAPSSR